MQLRPTRCRRERFLPALHGGDPEEERQNGQERGQEEPEKHEKQME